MAELDKNGIKAALDAFRLKFPTPDRELALDLLRKCGFSYKRSSDHSDIYKSPQLPNKPVTINKTTRLHEGYAKAIAKLAEDILKTLPDKPVAGGEGHGA